MSWIGYTDFMKNIDKLLHSYHEHLQKLRAKVDQAVTDEEIIAESLFSKRREPKAGLGDRWADRIATFGGSWTFILSFAFIFVVWVSANMIILSQPFDPYPFILLNLALSTLAAIQAPIILMSQNRQNEKDRQRAEDDYLINLKAEIEIRNLHKKMDVLLLDNMDKLFQVQQAQLEMLEELVAKTKK